MIALLIATATAAGLGLAAVAAWWRLTIMQDGPVADVPDVIEAMRADAAKSGLPWPRPGVSLMASEYVAALPTRIAQVTHALMEAWTQAGGGAPVSTADVMQYDGETLSLGATRQALSRAMRRYRLADRAGRGLWSATGKAWELRRALEDRVLGSEGGHRG